MNAAAKPALKLHLNAEELVYTIRQGLEARDWRFNPLPVAGLSADDQQALERLASLTNLHEVAARSKPGRLSLPVRLVRKFVRAVLRPWTEHQALFNQVAAQILSRQSGDLHKRLTAENDALRKRLEEVRYQWFELNRRVEELEAQAVAAR